MVATANVLRALSQRDPDRAAELLTDEFPWLRWMLPDERTQCMADLLADLTAGAETGTLLLFGQTVAAWRSTAEVWADPDLAARLSGPFDGTGEAITRPEPESERRNEATR
ncbi:MAG TPA: hypothetical protein VH352_12925 [Pseudonocardiaceae bacterium]|jgi:hypothetical protein|nr:hypothetical protein [Pseudonocardiaceae bacterium]